MSDHLYLTGYRGCGKSTVALSLANRLKMEVVDLDEVIEAASGTTIAEIFATELEAGFRTRETEALQATACRASRIISLGGGAILSPINREIIRSTGWCVWLDADAATIADRLAADATTRDRRPSLTGDGVLHEIESVMRIREPLYREASDIRIDTFNKSIKSIVDEIVTRWNDRSV